MRAYGSHLYRRAGTYYFRLVIPKNLLGIFSNCELRRSLDTGNKSRAQHRARRVNFELRNLFDTLEAVNMAKKPTQQEIRAIVDGLFRTILDESERRVASGGPLSLPALYERQRNLEQVAEATQLSLAASDHARVAAKAHKIAAKYDLDAPEGSPEFAYLCHELLKMRLNFERVALARRTGNYSHEEQYLKTPAAQAPAPPTAPDLTLGELITRYLNDPAKRAAWKDGTLLDIQSALDHLTFILGQTLPLRTITKAVMHDFRGKLLQMPPSRAKIKAYNGMTPQQIIASRPTKSISATTANNVLTHVCGLFNYAVELDALPSNPASRLKVKSDKRPDEQREAFTVADLCAIFGQEGYTSDAFNVGWKFWVPLIALYTGARMEEIAQLHLTDIRQEDGVWVIDINEAEDKSVKNAQSVRLAPLHDDLLGRVANLPVYRQAVAATGATRLFPELEKKGKDRFGKSVSQFFSRTVEKLGIKGRKSFHSFRHTFFTRLYEAGVGEVDLKKAGGHKVAGETFSRYCKPLSPAVLKERVFDRLSFPGLVLGHLAASKYSGVSH